MKISECKIGGRVVCSSGEVCTIESLWYDHGRIKVLVLRRDGTRVFTHPKLLTPFKG